MYFHCTSQKQCLKRAFIRFTPDNTKNIEIFLSTSEHNHLEKNKLPLESKQKVIEINYCTSKKKKIKKIKILLNYLYYNRDIWSGNKILYDCFNKKASEFASSKPIVFNKYLLLFGYNCPYPKSDGSICLEHISSDDRLCDYHKEIIPRVKSEILSGLTTFPKDICDIIFKFTMCYKQH